jgi:hypothetical protein
LYFAIAIASHFQKNSVPKGCGAQFIPPKPERQEEATRLCYRTSSVKARFHSCPRNSKVLLATHMRNYA